MRGHFSHSFNKKNRSYALYKIIAKTVLAVYSVIILRHRKPFHFNTLKIQIRF